MDPSITHHRPQPAYGGARQGMGAIARGMVHHARTALAVFVAVVVLGTLLALLMPAHYRSEARLLALPSDYYAVHSGTDKAGTPDAEPFKPEELAAVEMQFLSSQDLQLATLQRAGVPPAGLDRARQRFAKNLRIEQVEGANVIEIGYVGDSPVQASGMLQTLLAAYFESRAQVLTTGRVALLTRQRDAAGQDLATATAALLDFKNRNGIADIGEQINGAVALDTQLREDQATTRAQLSETQGSVARLRSPGAQVPSSVELYSDDSEATKAVADMQAKILDLKGKRADLAGRYMAGSPLIDQLDKQIAGLQSAIDRQSGDLRVAHRYGRNTFYDAAVDRIHQDVASAGGQSAKLTSLSGELAASGTRLRDLNAVATTLDRLQTARDLASDRYKRLSVSLDEARGSQLVQSTGSTNVRVIQQPTVPDRRENPPALLIAGSVLAGLVLAAATLFLLAMRRDVVLDRSEAALGLPVVADLTTPLRPGVGLALPHAGARVVAIVGTEASSYRAAVGGVIRGLEALAAGSVAVVTFEDAAYGLGRAGVARMVAAGGRHARVTVGSVAWSLGRTGADLLGSLRERYRWIVVVIPPVTAASPDEARESTALAAAALADDVLLLQQVAVSRRHHAELVCGALAEIGGAASGIVMTGRRIDWPRWVRAWG